MTSSTYSDFNQNLAKITDTLYEDLGLYVYLESSDLSTKYLSQRQAIRAKVSEKNETRCLCPVHLFLYVLQFSK
jgi:hypothetical protein